MPSYKEIVSENEALKRELERMKCENAMLKNTNSKLMSQNYYLKRKNNDSKINLMKLKEKVKELEHKFDLSNKIIKTLENCVSEVPKQLFECTAKRSKGKSEQTYHPAVKKVALSLHLCSSKAYR